MKEVTKVRSTILKGGRMRSRRSAVRALVVLSVLALGVLGFAGVASANGGKNGPPTPTISDPYATTSGGANEQQVISPTWQGGGQSAACTALGITIGPGHDACEVPNAGTWTITFQGQTTAALSRTANAAAVQTALQALSNIGSGNATVTAYGSATLDASLQPYGDNGKSWQVDFVGALAKTNLSTMSINTSGLQYTADNITYYNGFTGSVGTTIDGAPASIGATDISPHGGYSTSTDYCLQCHSVHGGAQWQGGSGGGLVNVTHLLPSGSRGITDYALLAQPSVTDVCATCHSLFGASAPAVGSTGPTPQDGGGLGRTVGTASVRTAYDSTGSAAVSEHEIGFGAIGSSQQIPLGSGVPCLRADGTTSSAGAADCSQITEGGWSYSWKQDTWNGTTGGPPNANSAEPAQNGTAGSGQGGWGSFGTGNGNTANSGVGGGLYCGSCHTPHGDFGQVVNARFVNYTDSGGTTTEHAVANDSAVYASSGSKFLEKQTTGGGGVMAGVWYLCDTASGGTVTLGPPGNCKPWTTTDANGQTGMYLYGYKILAAFPNHTYGQAPQSYLADNHSHDVANWCGTCHTDATDFSGAYHNHPTGCTSCHGSPSTISGTGSLVLDTTKPLDFPHTSVNAMFLKALPDGLCISCHKSGKLP